MSTTTTTTMPPTSSTTSSPTTIVETTVFPTTTEPCDDQICVTLQYWTVVLNGFCTTGLDCPRCSTIG